MKELSDHFYITKSIKLIIPKNDFELYIYLLPLLNINWLFPNLLEIELDFTTELSQFNDDPSPEKSLMLIKKNRDKFLLMIFYCYFISIIENLRSLSFKVYECYLIEIDYVLKDMKVLTNEFHFLNFLSNVFNLNKLSFDFNCLDSITFEKIICLIHRNNYFMYSEVFLYLKQEVEDSEYYYSASGLSTAS